RELCRGRHGLPLDSVQHLLRLYVEALTGREVDVAPLAAVPSESRIGDGRTIHLPSLVNEFGDDDLDFRLYKVLSAHAAGQIEFGTHDSGESELHAAFTAINEKYDPESVNALDAFAIADESLDENLAIAGSLKKQRADPQNLGYSGVLRLFP